MATWRPCYVLPVLLTLTLPSESRAATHRMPNFGQILYAANGFTVPAAWAGVWHFEDTIRNCGSPTIIGTDSGDDTLCVGQALEPGMNFTCSGTINDTHVDITCTGGFQISGCAVSYTQTVQATRTGDTAALHMTMSTTYTPTMCGFVPDSCEDHTEQFTRTGPQPATCTTPNRKSSWGSLKLLYR